MVSYSSAVVCVAREKTTVSPRWTFEKTSTSTVVYGESGCFAFYAYHASIANSHRW